MTIYIDEVILINFIMDFYILSGVKFLLKRREKIYKMLLGSLVGSISILLLFFNLNNLLLNLFKILISVLMIIVSFGIKDFKQNIIYMYLISVILGGSLYLINDSFGYKVDGLLFINKGYSINLICLIILSPLIIFLYIKETLRIKKLMKTTYKIDIIFKNKTLNLTGFLDTGNKLIDPYKHRPIILINKDLININKRKIILVPFKSLNNKGILKCIKCEYIILNDKKIYDVLIGIGEIELGIDCILNERLIE